MSVYLTADGGGTKLQVVAFDEELHVLGTGTAGGTNANFIPAEEVTRNMRQTVEQALGEQTRVETAWATIVGDAGLFRRIIEEQAELGEFVLHMEGLSYLLAGVLTAHGCVALAGTGSGAVYIDGEVVCHYGGYGSVIGDDGSGWWIGSHGVNAVIRADEGWGPPTALTEKLLRFYGISSVRGLLSAIYGGKRDARSASASFCQTVGDTASEGDPVARQIIREAASLLAAQMGALFRRYDLGSDMPVVCCGGAWKCTPLLREDFIQELRALGIEAPVLPARYSPVLHGPVALLLRQGRDPMQYVERLDAIQKAL